MKHVVLPVHTHYRHGILSTQGEITPPRMKLFPKLWVSKWNCWSPKPASSQKASVFTLPEPKLCWVMKGFQSCDQPDTGDLTLEQIGEGEFRENTKEMDNILDAGMGRSFENSLRSKWPHFPPPPCWGYKAKAGLEISRWGLAGGNSNLELEIVWKSVRTTSGSARCHSDLTQSRVAKERGASWVTAPAVLGRESI